MKLKRVMIAAPKSGSGKTMLTCALLQALKNAGQQTAAYKCGPDYIDPMFHREVIGVSSGNLDTFFTGETGTKALFLKDRKPGDFAVLEGVMGLYDGLGGLRPEGSSYDLARVTKTPVILAVDAKGMGRSVIPLIAGFLAYDKEGLIRGVLLNRMSGGYYDIVGPLIEKELSVPVVGYFPEQRELQIESRHLGLYLPHEVDDMRERLQRLAEEFQKTVSLEKITEIAEGAEELEPETGNRGEAVSEPDLSGEPGPGAEPGEASRSRAMPGRFGNRSGKRPLIAVAKDEAFCFYYGENLRLLEEKGGEIRYFSPLRDKALPEGCSGILLGGGYPELYGEELGANRAMTEAIIQAMEKGMPVVAECGGFLYLHSFLTDRQGRRHTMAGALPGECHDAGRLVRFGYIELEEKHSRFLPPGERIRGHEFHYFDSEDNGTDCLAVKPVTGKSYPCVLSGENYWLGFPHLYYPSNPGFAERFVELAAEYENTFLFTPCRKGSRMDLAGHCGKRGR